MEASNSAAQVRPQSAAAGVLYQTATALISLTRCVNPQVDPVLPPHLPLQSDFCDWEKVESLKQSKLL